MIELRTLGELSVSAEGRHVRLGTRKQYALLVYLAVHHGRVLRREQLASLLWEQTPISRARHSLSQTLYELRKRLPGLIVRLEGEEVWLEEGTVLVDTLEFRAMIAEQRFADATASYHGHFLDGFWIDNAPAWEAWQEGERDQLSRTARQAFRHLLGNAEARGDWLKAEWLSSKLLEFDPYDESVHRLRIRAIAAGGDRARAVTECQNLQEVLVRELQRPPQPETATLFRQIAVLEPPVKGSPQVSDDDEPLTSFVGRGDEFQMLQEQWHDVTIGHGRTIIISGEAGIGKTRFSHHFLRFAVLRDARILRGRCYSSERQIPYSAIVDALLTSLGPNDLAALPSTWSSAIVELLPELRQESSDYPPVLLDGEGARRRLFESIARLFISMADSRPIVLFIDDLHWADDSTAALVHYLARRLRTCSVMLLLALRSEDVAIDSALGNFLSRRLTADGIRFVGLSELSPSAVEQLIDSYEERVRVQVHREVRTVIRSKVGGRPFLIIEMLKTLQEHQLNIGDRQIPALSEVEYQSPLPASLTEFLGGRYRHLSAAATEIVSSLAVLGKQAAPDVVRKVSGLGTYAFLRSLDELVRKRIINDQGNDISFAHDLLREAAYGSLSGVRRRFLHERAASVLRALPQTAVGTLAMHYDLAGNNNMAFEHARRAAQAADKLFAYGETEYFLRMTLTNAATSEQRLVAHRDSAHFFYKYSRYMDAEEHFAYWEKHSMGPTDDRERLLIRINRAAIHLSRHSMPIDELTAHMQQLATTAETVGDHDMLADILRKLAVTAHDTGKRDVMLFVAATLLKLVREIGMTRSGIRTLSMAASIIGLYRSFREGLDLSDAAVQHAQDLNDPEIIAVTLKARAKNRLLAGFLKSASDDVMWAQQLIDNANLLITLQDIRFTKGSIWMEYGDFDRAEGILRDVIRATEETGSSHEMIIAHGNLMTLYIERWCLAEAKSTARQVLSWRQSVTPWWPRITAWSTMGLCALDDHDVEEASRCHREVMLADAGRDFQGADVSYVEMFLARYAALEGKVDAALERLDRAIAAYEQRDVFCRSRLQLERARLLMDRDPRAAWLQAGEVRSRAVEIGARPLVVKADAILDRLPGLEG